MFCLLLTLDFAFGFEVSYMQDYFANVWWLNTFHSSPCFDLLCIAKKCNVENFPCLGHWTILWSSLTLGHVCPWAAMVVASQPC